MIFPSPPLLSGLGRVPASAAGEKGGSVGASAWDWAIKLVMLLVLTQFGVRLPDTATLHPHHMLLLCTQEGIWVTLGELGRANA